MEDRTAEEGVVPVAVMTMLRLMEEGGEIVGMEVEEAP